VHAYTTVIDRDFHFSCVLLNLKLP
jgi:hypothetical protein